MSRMADTSLVDLVSTAGAALIGGLAGPWLLRGPERRAARASVQTAFAEMDVLRSKPGLSWHEYDSLERNIRKSALIARLPRDAVDLFTTVSEICWKHAQFRESPRHEDVLDSEFPGEFVVLLSNVDDLMVDLCWKPWIARIGLRRRLNKIDRYADYAMKQFSYPLPLTISIAWGAYQERRRRR